MHWSGDGVIWKAGDVDKVALEVREKKMVSDNDVLFWQSLPDSPADVVTRFKLNKDGTIAPACKAGKEFVLGHGWSNRIVLVTVDSANKIFWERIPEPSFSLAEAT